MFQLDEIQNEKKAINFYNNIFKIVKKDLIQNSYLPNIIQYKIFIILESHIDKSTLNSSYEQCLNDLIYKLMIEIRQIKKKVLNDFLNFQFDPEIIEFLDNKNASSLTLQLY